MHPKITTKRTPEKFTRPDGLLAERTNYITWGRRWMLFSSRVDSPVASITNIH